MEIVFFSYYDSNCDQNNIKKIQICLVFMFEYLNRSIVISR